MSRLYRPFVLVALLTLLALAPPRDAEAQDPGFAGEAPGPGQVALLVTSRAISPADLAASLGAAGCDAETIAITEAGDWVLFVPGAPAFVNEGFPATLDGGRGFFVRCRAAAGARFTLFSASGGQTGVEAVTQDVRVASHPGFDRFVIEVREDVIPEYRIEYIDPPAFTCGAGSPVTPAGNAVLEITLPQTRIDDPETSELTIPSRELTPDLPAIKEAREICGFEGMSIWVLGLDERQPFRVFELTSPSRIVVDVPH